MPVRTLVVGLDSAEPALVRRWAAAGRLPHLAGLLAGHSRDINNLPGFGNGVFWPSIHTGTDPSCHGGYYLRQPQPPDYRIEPFTRHDYLRPPFWRAMEADGLAVAVIDPVEAPAGGLRRGIEVLDWNVHRREAPPVSNPPELVQRLIRDYGDNPFHGNVDRMVSDGLAPERLSALSDARIRNKTEAVLALLAERDWDLFMVSFADPHDIGHRAWHLHDGCGAGVVDPLQRCYEQLDAALGRLMASVTPDGGTIVVMGPGMERNVTGRLLLPDLLRAFQGLPVESTRPRLRRGIRRLIRSRLLPWGIRDALRSQRLRAATEVRRRAGHRYGMLPHNDDASAIRINLAGREPHGLVPAEAYGTTCDELEERLLALTDASAERPAVSEVIRVHRQYAGPALDRLPDLLVVWNRTADLRCIRSREFGEFHGHVDSMRTGDHSRRGLMLSDRAFGDAPAGPLSPMQVTPLLNAAVRARAARQSGCPGSR